MTFEECLFGYIASCADIAVLIGSRIYPDFFRQGEPLPAVAYSLEDDRSIETQQGPSSLREALYRFDIWAETAKDAMKVMRALRSALDGFKGAMGDQDDVRALFDGADRIRDSETMAFCVSMRFRIWYHQEQSPA